MEYPQRCKGKNILMKKILILITLSSLVIAGLGCGPLASLLDRGVEVDPLPTTAPVITQPTSAPIQQGGSEVETTGMVDIFIDNQTGQSVCYLLISPTTDDMWGDDWLGDEEILDNGDTRWVTLPSEGMYDMMWMDCNQETIGEFYEVFAGAGASFTLIDN